MKTIIAAVDFSDATPGVLEMACRLAKSFAADLQLFHVIDPEPTYIAYGFTAAEFPAMNSLREEANRRATLKLKELLATVHADLPDATSHMVVGSPLHALLDHVKQTGADLVVLGSHGHGKIASLLLGSVAEGMTRRSTVPTLVVPGPAR